MNNLEGKTELIGKLFSSDFFFTIPDYQRPFAWEQDNFTDLIDDLATAQSDQQYFLGTLVLHKTDEKQNYDVVDGQQRLTTLLILIACLRDLIEDDDFKKQLQGKIVQEENKVDGIPEKARITVKDRSIFRELVLAKRGTETDKKEKDLVEPEVRYLQAIHIFKEKLQEYSQEQLQKFIQFVNQKCVVIYLATSSFDDAFKLFTIVNDRGRQLRRIDILKAQNISPDAVPLPATRDKISKEWENLENDLGESNLESILSLIRMIFLKEKPAEDIFNEFEKRIFRKGLLTRGEKFVDVVKSYGELYRSIFIDRDFVEEDNSIKIKYKSLIYIMDKEFSASEWRACVLSYAKKFNEKDFYKFLLKLEKVYLEAWTKGVRKDERFSIYSTILRAIEASEKTTDVLNSIKFKEQPIKKVVTSKNFYLSRYAKYLLLRLEILTSENDAVKEFNAKSIEHVFPQNPASGSNWRNDPDYKSLNSVVHTIGNLVLLSKGKNSSASNLEFDKKKEKYLKERVSDYPRSIQILTEADWTIAKIRERNKDIQERILDDF
ncbi:DUF262 domain-containing protein [Spirochaeta lutea]|uniref:DUF262 domain-containing protein n=1 Tax=Spirochaeta lutea TaxID=1480694 RepID=A0A098R0J8_9SPIO|nr:DUF262 domain-containing protein [Spirochaeta lutea]KGE73276.1 hypothetical protein DC28_04855 [Spirochaeta lutea]